METKTPVSALQEYCVKRKIIPTYDLIHRSGETHNPEFVYRVFANGLSEEGRGSSKQKAKHRAAEKLLVALNETDSLRVAIPEHFTPEINPIENYVGQLKDHCLLNSYAQPTFFAEEESGPPHSKIFKLKCDVSQLSEYGIAKTKKQAKQLAAYNMLERLRKIPKDRGNLMETNNSDSDVPCAKVYIRIPPRTITTEELIAKQNALRSKDVVKKPIVYYNDHQRAYLGLEEESETLKKVLLDESVICKDSALSLLDSIAKELGASLVVTSNKVFRNNQDIYFISLGGKIDLPYVTGMGFEEANAALNLIDSLKVLCSDP